MKNQRSVKDVCSLLGCLAVCIGCLFATGCAEGVLWKSGKYAPWVRDKWAAEEQIADTLFTRKRRMNESVASVANAPIEQQQPVAEKLAEVVHRDPILLIRLHAVKLLAQLNCPKAVQTLDEASTDPNSDVRIAAINSLQTMSPEIAIPRLQEVIGSDSDVDVRLAATRALGNFQGQSAVGALSLALDDRNPALQIRATESLARSTGQDLGRDVGAWQKYVAQVLPQSMPDQSAPNSQPFSTDADLPERYAESPSLFR